MICMNTRCLAAPMTGTQRYTSVLLGRLEDHVRSVAPPGAGRGLRGHFWEQSLLPRRIGKGDLLFSPSNTGPARMENQVVTVHDLCPVDHPECMGRWFGLWYRKLWKRLLPRVRRVLTVSRFTRQRILDVYGLEEDQVVVAPLAAGTEFCPADPKETAAAREAAGLPQGPYVLTVGTIEPRKNLTNLLLAWKQVRQRHPEMHLVVVGAVGAQSVFGQAARQEIPAGVILAGRQNDAHLPGLYSGAAVMVYPSLYEGFGLPVLEAMACGTPVVASDAPAVREVAGQAARIVEARRPEAIAEGLLDTLENAHRQDLSLRSLARAAEFSWDRTARRTMEVLQEAHP
jgi:glycosyltransferase involved in cell wall biosynthesis